MASFLWLSNASLMQLYLAGNYCKDYILKSPNHLPISIRSRNAVGKDV